MFGMIVVVVMVLVEFLLRVLGKLELEFDIELYTYSQSFSLVQVQGLV